MLRCCSIIVGYVPPDTLPPAVISVQIGPDSRLGIRYVVLLVGIGILHPIRINRNTDIGLSGLDGQFRNVIPPSVGPGFDSDWPTHSPDFRHNTSNCKKEHPDYYPSRRYSGNLFARCLVHTGNVYTSTPVDTFTLIDTPIVQPGCSDTCSGTGRPSSPEVTVPFTVPV